MNGDLEDKDVLVSTQAGGQRQGRDAKGQSCEQMWHAEESAKVIMTGTTEFDVRGGCG